MIYEFRAWGPQHIADVKGMYERSKIWTDELVANVTGPEIKVYSIIFHKISNIQQPTLS